MTVAANENLPLGTHCVGNACEVKSLGHPPFTT